MQLSRRENREARARACMRVYVCVPREENSAAPPRAALGIIALNRVTSGRTCARNSRGVSRRAEFLARELWNQSARPAR